MRRQIVVMMATVLVTGACVPESEPRRSIVVFAAVSTTDVLREAGRRFEVAGGPSVTFNFDSSSNLAKQIKTGAPADVFVSADEVWMDDAASAGLIQIGTRENLLGNRLVLITERGRNFAVDLTKEFDAAAAQVHVERIAVGDPMHVPAGRYARQALESLGWWKSLKCSLIPTQDARSALRLVEMGEADAGIVYGTDALRSDKVTVVGEFPPETHQPIRYAVAVCKGGSGQAVEFLRFLRTSEMKALFEQAGFTVLSPSYNRRGAEP